MQREEEPSTGQLDASLRSGLRDGFFTLMIMAAAWYLWGEVLSSYRESHLITALIALLGLIYALSALSTIYLYPRKRFLLLRVFYRMAQWPIPLLDALTDYVFLIFAPLGAFASVVLFSMGASQLLRSWSSLTAIGEIATWYLSLVLACTIFVHLGRDFTAFILRLDDNAKEHERILSLVRPARMRQYMFIALAATFILARIELFSGSTLLHWHFWAAYKEVILEVLLTFVAIDRVLCGPKVESPPQLNKTSGSNHRDGSMNP